MSADEMVADVLAAYQEALDLHQQQQDATDRRAELIRKALESGVGATTLAEVLDVSRQRVYIMAKARRGG